MYCIAQLTKHRQEEIYLAKFPDTPGSLGIAISEAIEAAVTDPTGQTRYCLRQCFQPCYAASNNYWIGSKETA